MNPTMGMHALGTSLGFGEGSPRTWATSSLSRSPVKHQQTSAWTWSLINDILCTAVTADVTIPIESLDIAFEMARNENLDKDTYL